MKFKIGDIIKPNIKHPWYGTDRGSVLFKVIDIEDYEENGHVYAVPMTRRSDVVIKTYDWYAHRFDLAVIRSKRFNGKEI